LRNEFIRGGDTRGFFDFLPGCRINAIGDVFRDRPVEKEDILKELAADLDAGLVDFSGAAERTEEFTDAVTLYSPDLAEMVLEGEMPDDGQIADVVLRGEIIPCMFGSALKMEGVEGLLEVLGRYTREPAYGEEFGARVYKTAASDEGERLSFIKITGGELKVKDKVRINSASGDEDGGEEKVNRIMLFSGSRCVSVDSAAAGTVCAVTGLTQALPGDGLGAEPPLNGSSIRRPRKQRHNRSRPGQRHPRQSKSCSVPRRLQASA
jgi:translation elongation factor EF-G